MVTETEQIHELKTGTHNDYYLNNEILLKRNLVVNNLDSNAIVIPTPLIYTLLHVFHNCKGHQGSVRTFNMLKCKFWWKGMRLDIKPSHQHLYNLFKNLLNTACYPNYIYKY